MNICKNCSTAFKTIKSTVKYCSYQCNNAALYKLERANIILDKKCLACNKDFVAQRQTTKYCSTKCSSAHFKKLHPWINAAGEAKRRATRLRAIPKWLTKEQLKEMQNFYKNRPEGYHVDHIVPLLGKNVRGLHVPWNLQYLPKEVNLKKGNRG